MECKNCEENLVDEARFCKACGAKVVRNRLTFKNLWDDITTNYFNLDSSVFLTLIHLITKPESVITGYINGLRRRYLNPVSYLGIALTLSGVLLFLIQKVFKDRIDLRTINDQVRGEAMEGMMETLLDFSSFVFVLYIPIFAFAARLVYNKKNYLMTEQVVTFLYVLGQYSILSFPFSLLVLIFFPEDYMRLGIPMVLSMFLYALYVLQRIHRYKPLPFAGRSFVFLMLCFIGYIGVVFFIMGMMFATGVVSLEDFRPVS